MSSNPLRDFAEKYEAFGGEVTFYMCPFPTFETDHYLIEFERQHPRTKWVNSRTGEETLIDPHPGANDDPILKAQREASEWQEVSLWSPAHSFFLACVPATVDIEFKSKLTKPAARGLRAYWQEQNGSIEHNWELFRQTMGHEASTTWLEAYSATRDNSMDGPAEIATDPDEDTDPNA